MYESTNLIHLAVAVLVLIGLVFLSITGILSPVLDWGRLAVNFFNFPLVKIFSGSSDFAVLFFSLKDLAAQNEILTRQVEELTVQIANLEEASLENKVLREALNFRVESKLTLIPAEIISLDPLNVNQRVFINRGASHGIARGDAVAVSGGILVGVVSDVFEHTSSIELVTSSTFVVNAQTLPSGATGVVKGEHGLGLLFDLVSQSDVINTGERIVTSGLGGSFPKNLLIGEIGEIRSSQSELFQRASIIPAANLRNLRVIFVVKL